jgi:hypothetical protein
MLYRYTIYKYWIEVGKTRPLAIATTVRTATSRVSARSSLKAFNTARTTPALSNSGRFHAQRVSMSRQPAKCGWVGGWVGGGVGSIKIHT